MPTQTKRETLSESVVRYLQEQGVNQSQIGRLLKVDRSFISHVSKGQRNFTIDHLERLAEAFEMTVATLLAQATPPEKVSAPRRTRYKLLLKGLAASGELRAALAKTTGRKKVHRKVD